MGTRDEYAEKLKSSAISIGVNASFAWATGLLPFLGAPIIRILVRGILNSIISNLVKQTEFGLFFFYIDMRVGEQSKSFEAAAERNRLAQLTGTPKQKAEAEAALISEFRTFSKFTS